MDTFHTEEIPYKVIEQIVKEVFDFSVAGIISKLSLIKVSYEPLSAYGHFGRTDLQLPWEKTDKITQLQQKAAEIMAEDITGLIRENT